MKKILIAVTISFFTFQMPAFSVWIGHDDFTETDSEPDEEGRHIRTSTRNISVNFTKQKPDENKNKTAKGKINFTRSKIVEAINSIETLLRPLKTINSINLYFWEVKNNKHLSLIKQVLNSNSFDFHSMEYNVDFNINAMQAIRDEYAIIDSTKSKVDPVGWTV